MVCGILAGCTKKDTEPAQDNNNQQEEPKPEPKPEPEKYISFEDYTVKQICINMWDTNGDGRFSEKEAAAVRSIGSAFRDKKIIYFDEFRYFTGITEIPEKAFYYSESTSVGGINFLERITIPKNVRKIGSNAFSFREHSDTRLKMLPTVPPTLGGPYLDSATIYVPSSSVEKYKKANYWSLHSSRIKGY